MKKIMIALLVVAAMAMTLFTACQQPSNDGYFTVPEAMRGSWTSNTGIKLEATKDNIVIDFGSGGGLDLKSTVGMSPQIYNCTSTSTSLSVTANSGTVGYHFTLNGDTLTMRLVAGSSRTVTFSKG